MSRGYKTDCPACGGHNLYVTPDNGVEYCFNCGYSKGNRSSDNQTVLMVSERLEEIRDYYQRLAAYYHACITPEVRNYLHRRGLTDEIIQQNQLGYCPAGVHPIYEDSVAREAGVATSGGASVLAGRVIFPYRAGGQTVDLRGRALSPEEEVKYKGPYGRAPYRGADEWPYLPEQVLQTTQETVVVTEGELKALVCAAHGIPAMALPGINSWKWRMRSLFAAKRRVIVFDSQKEAAVAEQVYSAVDSLAFRLTESHVLFLPLHGDKTDVDGFILTNGPESFRMWLDYSLPYERWATLMRRNSYVPR